MTKTNEEVKGKKLKNSADTAQSECNSLLCCPFCGCKDIDIRIRKTAIIECEGCGALFIKGTVENAKKAWNNRSKEVTPKIEYVFCNNCKNILPDIDGKIRETSYCGKIKNINLVTGEVKNTHCGIARGNGEQCGVGGLFFET
jgi:hypothetical protein